MGISGEILQENEEEADKIHGGLFDCVDKYTFELRVVRLVAAPLNPTYAHFLIGCHPKSFSGNQSDTSMTKLFFQLMKTKKQDRQTGFMTS